MSNWTDINEHCCDFCRFLHAKGYCVAKSHFWIPSAQIDAPWESVCNLWERDEEPTYE